MKKPVLLLLIVLLASLVTAVTVTQVGFIGSFSQTQWGDGQENNSIVLTASQVSSTNLSLPKHAQILSASVGVQAPNLENIMGEIGIPNGNNNIPGLGSGGEPPIFLENFSGGDTVPDDWSTGWTFTNPANIKYSILNGIGIADDQGAGAGFAERTITNITNGTVTINFDIKVDTNTGTAGGLIIHDQNGVETIELTVNSTSWKWENSTIAYTSLMPVTTGQWENINININMSNHVAQVSSGAFSLSNITLNALSNLSLIRIYTGSVSTADFYVDNFSISSGSGAASSMVSALQDYLDSPSCASNATGECIVPLYFNSSTSQILNLSELEINYSVQYNLTYQNETLEKSSNSFILDVYSNLVNDLSITYNNSEISGGSEVDNGQYSTYTMTHRPDWVIAAESESFNFNLTVFFDFNSNYTTATYDQSVQRMIIEDCSAYPANPWLDTTILDEDTGSIIPTTTSIHILQIYLESEYRRNYTLSYPTSTTPFNICKYPAWANYSSEGQIFYEKTGYESRIHPLDIENVNYLNLSLYLLNSSASTDITANVFDQNNNDLEGATINIMKLNTVTGNYELVQVVNTNFEGQALFQAELTSAFYKFTIEYQNEILKETLPTQLFTSTLNFQVFLGELVGEEFFEINGINHDLTYSNTTNSFRFIYDDTTNLVTQGCLYVWELSALSETLINSSCVSGDVGLILLGISPENSTTYKAVSYVYNSANEEIYLMTIFHTETSPVQSESLSLFFMIILTIFFALVVPMPAAKLMLTPLPMIFFKLMGLISISWTVPISWMALAIVGTVIISRSS